MNAAMSAHDIERKKDFDALRNALANDRIELLEIERSPAGNPSQFNVKLRSSNPREIPVGFHRYDSWKLSGAGYDHVRVEPVIISADFLAKTAIENSDMATLALIDELVVGGPAEPVAPVRIMSYSSEMQTLSIEPPAPPHVFNVRAKEDDHVAGLDVEAPLRQLLRSSKVVVLQGAEPPPLVKKQLEILEHTPVRNSIHSPNRSLAEIESAAKLGDDIFAGGPATILQALPNPIWGPLGMWQLWSMKIAPGTGDRWRALRKSLDFSHTGYATNIIEAGRTEVLDHFARGNDNVLVLIAHSKDGRIYLANGDIIDVDELQKLKRAVAPNRAIILITCKAAGSVGSQRSIAEILLENRLAKSVFASTEEVDAEKLPELLRSLDSMPMREAFSALQIKQIVSLSGPGRAIPII